MGNLFWRFDMISRIWYKDTGKTKIIQDKSNGYDS
mgnify:CR=1 FL=1